MTVAQEDKKEEGQEKRDVIAEMVMAAREQTKDFSSTDDDGLNFLVFAARSEEKVVIDFGKPVTWLALDPEVALSFAQSIIRGTQALPRSIIKPHGVIV